MGARREFYAGMNKKTDGLPRPPVKQWIDLSIVGM